MRLNDSEPHKLFLAVGDPTRVRILRLLVTTKYEACLCDLAESLCEPEYKVSRHLKVLRSSGLLAAQKEGRWIYHKAVRGSPHISKMYSLVKTLPDPEGTFKRDLKSFLRLFEKRNGGRCVKSKDSDTIKIRKTR